MGYIIDQDYPKKIVGRIFLDKQDLSNHWLKLVFFNIDLSILANDLPATV